MSIQPVPKNIRIRYIRDIHNPDRVVTLAYRVNKDTTVSFGISINTPTEWRVLDDGPNFRTQVKVKGDKFVKRLGREIAMGRLNSRAADTLPVVEGSPLLSCLDFLSKNFEKHVSRIAENEADFLRWEMEYHCGDYDEYPTHI